ncbi:MAG: regulatory iron-sulfur-containing complex subunit RicT, partial [Minisyncoccales bacterium]
QSLSLNPTKISGLCGRLMCCLKYEQDFYEEARKEMPRINREVGTPEGKGIVLETNVLKQSVKVKMILEDDTVDVREFNIRDIQHIKRNSRDTGQADDDPKEDLDFIEE